MHNQTALFMKRLLLFEPNVVVTGVPFHLEESRDHGGAGPAVGRDGELTQLGASGA